MKIGIGLPSFASPSHLIPPKRLRRFVRLTEDGGFSGAWTIDHLIQPPTYQTSLLDPLTTLAVAAGETETLNLGTSVLALPLRNPVLVAKRAVTLGHLSTGRLTLGLGTGYVTAEFDAVGVPRQERSDRYLEGVELIKRLFTEDMVTFDGTHYSLTDFRLEPDTSQPPRMLAGGSGVETSRGRVVADGVKERLLHTDGWIAPSGSMEDLEHDWTALAEFLDSQGRDPDVYDRVGFQYFHLVPDSDSETAHRRQRTVYADVVGPDRSVEYALDNWLTGTVEDVRDTLAEYEAQGFDEIILHPTARDPDELEQQLRLVVDLLLPEYSG